MKKFTLLFSIFLLMFSLISPTVSNASVASVKNDKNEIFYDQEGNKIELEYIDSKEELRVNTYVNDMLMDYSIVQKAGDLSTQQIINYILEKPISKSALKLGSESLKFSDVKTYNVNDIVEEITSNDAGTYAVPGDMTFVKSGRNGYDPYVGNLYVNKSTQKTTKYMYDWVAGTLLSVIATAVTIVWSTAVVAVAVLLSGLGITFALNKITTPLNGSYTAYHYVNQYLVIVNDVWSLWHKNEEYNVIYYNDRNGQQLNRLVPIGGWVAPDDIILRGIERYKMGGV